jgi:hypothetical protein
VVRLANFGVKFAFVLVLDFEAATVHSESCIIQINMLRGIQGHCSSLLLVHYDVCTRLTCSLPLREAVTAHYLFIRDYAPSRQVHAQQKKAPHQQNS